MNDYTIKELQGGATVTGSIMIKTGRELGHKIDEYTPKGFNTYPNPAVTLNTYDLIILNNINSFKPELIEWIIENLKYIKYEHDYSFCQWRSAQCWRCKIKCTPADIFVKLYSNSLLNIFFSPLQLNIYKKFFGETMRDAVCIPAPMEREAWYPNKDIQQDAYLYAGVLMNHKGIHQILDFADSQKNKIFHFAGRVVDKKILDRIKEKYTYLGEIPYADMPKLLRKYKYFMINPQMPETFGLSVLEAMQSGCTIIKFAKSHEIGLESYNLSPGKMIERCFKAPDTFWKAIERK